MEGHVLLKNVDGALPLKKPLILSLYGYDARAAAVNYPGVGPLAPWALGELSTNVSVGAYGLAIIGGTLTDPPAIASLGTLISGVGSGTTTPGTIIDVSPHLPL